MRGRLKEGGDKCILMADKSCCMAESNTTLYNYYPQIKNKLKRKKHVVDGNKKYNTTNKDPCPL